MSTAAADDSVAALTRLGRAGAVAGVATALVLVIVLAAFQVGSGAYTAQGERACATRPGDAPYPLGGTTCAGFYDELVPLLCLLFGVGALVFVVASRLFVGPRGALHPRTGRLLAGVFGVVGALPVLLLSVYGIEDSFRGGQFYALRWLYVAAPGLAVLLCMIAPVVYYVRSGGWGYADYA